VCDNLSQFASVRNRESRKEKSGAKKEQKWTQKKRNRSSQ